MCSKLTACSIGKIYNNDNTSNTVLKGVSVSFEQGSTYAIKGVSGSGKSTLLHILGGFEEPTSGKVLFNKQNLYDINSRQLSSILNKKFGFVFQFHYLINELSVLENIMLVGEIGRISQSECKDKALALLNFLGLSHRISYKPYQLSGGEQQRVSIARALFNKPDFLLADEPTGNLDKKNAKIVVDLLLHCQREWKMGVIICSHDQYVCDSMQNVLVLADRYLQKN